MGAVTQAGPGREEKVGPYGKVYEIDDLWNNNPKRQSKRTEQAGNG